MFKFSDREPFAANYEDMEELNANLNLDEISPGRDAILKFYFLQRQANEPSEKYTLFINQLNLLEVAIVEEIESERFKQLLEHV